MNEAVGTPLAGKVGQPYRSWDGRGEYDTVVIGSGIGALTTAALLAKRASQRVLVLERHYVAGGYTHVFRRPGYEWDVGLHYVGQLHRPDSLLGAIFNEVTDGRVEWASTGDVYDRIVIAGAAYDFPAGQEAFCAGLVQHFPGEARTIDRYMALVQATARASRLYFAEKAIPAFIAWCAGRLMRWPFLRRARHTTGSVLRELTQNRQLISVLTGQWGDYGLPPDRSSFGIHAIVADHYLEGAAYPVGGASRIAAAMAPIVQRSGGQILINAEVSEILVERDRAVGVKLSDGRTVRARRVVSGVGVANTFGRLLPPSMAACTALNEKLSMLEPSLAHMNLYIGLRRSARELGFEGTNLWIYPTGEHDRNLSAYLADPAAPFPFAYISFPSVKDPTFDERFPGRSTIQVIAPAKYDWFRPWEDRPWQRRGENYDALKQQFADRLLETLYHHAPQVRGQIDHAELSTPLSTRHFANYSQGEPYGLAHTPSRFEQRFLKPRTPIANLFLTGQDITVCGIAGGLVSGVLCASAMLGRNLLSGRPAAE